MNRVKTLLAASIALALAFTISCSDDKDDDKSSDSKSSPSGGSKSSYCELTGSGFTYCLELPNNECSSDFEGNNFYRQAFTFKKVDKCEGTPDVACFYGKDNCGLLDRSYCETIVNKPAFKTIKECFDYEP